MANSDLLTLTADIVAAHLSHNKVAASDIPDSIQAVYGALAGLGAPLAPIVEVALPAVSIRASVKPDALTCLECGAKQKTLKRHLGVAHELTPAGYREKWNLPASYPMVAPTYTAQRSEMAKRIGLGRKPGMKVASKAKPGRKKPGKVTA
ncbi:MAG: transcriptional regulator, MucR family [Bradyrhizobium sp.]|nr:transcriptional regulator, MucR family [Bradyrhizobium sp.]